MSPYEVRPRNARYAPRISKAFLGAKRQASSSFSDSSSPRKNNVYRKWQDAFLAYDNGYNMNFPKISDSLKDILEHKGSREDFYEWRKITLFPGKYVWISTKRGKHCRESQIALIGEIWRYEEKTILVVRFWENYHYEHGLWKAYPSKHCQTLSVETVDDVCEGRQEGSMFITQNGQEDRVELDRSRARYYELMRSRSSPKKSTISIVR